MKTTDELRARVEQQLRQLHKTRHIEEILGKMTPAIIEAALDDALANAANLDLDYVFVVKNLEQYCKKCGECCRRNSFPVSREEIRRIASHLNKPHRIVRKEYFSTSPRWPGEPCLNSPCPFLRDNQCSIYPVRPSACLLFPFSVSKRMAGKMEVEIHPYCEFGVKLLAEKAFWFSFLGMSQSAEATRRRRRRDLITRAGATSQTPPAQLEKKPESPEDISMNGASSLKREGDGNE